MTDRKVTILIYIVLGVLGTLFFTLIFFGPSKSSIFLHAEPGAQYQTTVITKAGTWKYRTVKPVAMRRYPQGFIFTIGSKTDIYPSEGLIKISRIKLEK